MESAKINCFTVLPNMAGHMTVNRRCKLAGLTSLQRVFNLHPTCGYLVRNREGVKLGNSPRKVSRMRLNCSFLPQTNMLTQSARSGCKQTVKIYHTFRLLIFLGRTTRDGGIPAGLLQHPMPQPFQPTQGATLEPTFQQGNLLAEQESRLVVRPK